MERSLKVAVLVGVLCTAPVAAAASLILNGGFDETRPYQPDVPAPFDPPQPRHWDVAPFSSDMQTAGGDFFQNFLVVAEDSIYLGPDRDANAALAIYNRASLAQSFTVTSPGEHLISWKDAGPRDAASYNPLHFISTPEAEGLRYSLLLDGTVQGEFNTRLGEGYSFRSLTLSLAPGRHTLGFAGLERGEIRRFGSVNQYAEQTLTHIALLDDVAVSPVPEPRSWALLLLGLGLLAADRSRRRAGR